ncbi:class I SAM-dependent methyltransferase [Christensenellaceae bacterium OttesenSCG-928-L17]|nr:class I SAM-dependent methyltransferase [Christensenellaceae bacterium OttesenSCG-928-L17]
MYLAGDWQDYAILSAGGGEKLERWGDILLLRPDPQAIWPMPLHEAPHAYYLRSGTGGGYWQYNNTLPESWQVSYRDLTFRVRPTGFKHTGLFPEQAVNWDWMRNLVSARPGARVLNLFAYTGGATCALLKSGAQVLHVDAAKSINAWARENATLCGVADMPVRYIADDAMKFVLREQRRGNRYDAILMDPPSYGRGPGGEMWKIEDDLYPLVEAASKLLSDDPLFFVINSYTTGLAQSVIQNVLQVALCERHAHIEADEVGLPIENGGLVLPCGVTGRATFPK